MAKRTANWFKTRSAFEKELMSNAKGVNKAVAQVLVQASNNFVQKTHEMSTLPYYTGNLRDSIASAVSQSGRVIRASYLQPSYQMTDPKWKPQSMNGRKRIVGMQEAERAVHGYNYPATGVSAVLFVGVPYAQQVNDGTLGKSAGNLGFIERLNEQFAADMDFAMAALKNFPTIVAGKIVGNWRPLAKYASRAELEASIERYK